MENEGRMNTFVFFESAEKELRFAKQTIDDDQPKSIEICYVKMMLIIV